MELTDSGGTAHRCLAPIWQAELPPLGLTPVVEAFGGECSEAEINRLVDLANTHTFTAVVGAGGGKASNIARGIANESELPVVITLQIGPVGSQRRCRGLRSQSRRSTSARLHLVS